MGLTPVSYAIIFACIVIVAVFAVSSIYENPAGLFRGVGTITPIEPSTSPEPIETPEVAAKDPRDTRVELTEFNTKYGGKWYVQKNKITQAPERIYGSSIPVTSIKTDTSEVTKDNVEEITKEFLRSNQDVLKVNPDDLEITRVWDNRPSENSDKRIVISHYTQNYKGIPIEGRTISTTFSENNLVLYKGGHGEIDISTIPQLTKDQAFEASKNFEIAFSNNYNINLYQGDLIIISPTKEYNDYRLAWKIIVRLGSEESSNFVLYYIDANTGDKIIRDNLVEEDTITGTLDGRAYDTSPIADYTPVATDIGFDDVPVYIFRTGFGLIANDTSKEIQGDHGKFSITHPDISSGISYQVGTSFPYSTRILGTSENGFEPPGILSSGIYYISSNAYAGDDVYYDIALDDNTYQGRDADVTGGVGEASNAFYHINWVKNYFSKGGYYNITDFDGSDILVDVIIGEGSSEYPDLNAGPCEAYARNNLPMYPHIPPLIRLGPSGDYTSIFSGITGWCESKALLTASLYHEYTHIVTAYTYYPIGFLQRYEKPITEAHSMYWAGNFINYGGDAAQLGSEGWPNDYVFSLVNGRIYPDDYNDSDLIPGHGIEHKNGLILAGGMWDLREYFLQDAQGQGLDYTVGVEWANDRMIMTMKEKPMTFEEYLADILLIDDLPAFGGDNNPSTGTPNIDKICQAFCANHGIWDPECGFITDPDCAPSDDIVIPAGHIYAEYNVPPDRGLIDGSFTEFQSIGSAEFAPGEGSFSLGKRVIDSEWDSAGIELTGGGLVSVSNSTLGTTDANQLLPGCFYQSQLTVDAAGTEEIETVTFKKMPTPRDTFPRMVCMTKTTGHGPDDHACELIAVVTDPKPLYYSLDNDWRRGADVIPETFQGEKICDPPHPDHYACSEDCWEIQGVTMGGDGLIVFCPQDYYLCDEYDEDPPSYAGCDTPPSASDPTCIPDSIAELEEAYHKIVFYQWTDQSGAFNGCNHDTSYYIGRLGYKQIETFGGLNPRCTEPRCGNPMRGDKLDGFATLWADKWEIEVDDENFIRAPERTFETPVLNCGQCGCFAAGDRQNCERTTDTCNQDKIFVTPNKDFIFNFDGDGGGLIQFNRFYIGNGEVRDPTHPEYLWDFNTRALIRFNVENIDGITGATLHMYSDGVEGQGLWGPMHPDVDIFRIRDFYDPGVEDVNNPDLVSFGELTFTPNPSGGWDSIDVTPLVTGDLPPVNDSIVFRLIGNDLPQDVGLDRFHMYRSSASPEYAPYLEITYSSAKENYLINGDFEITQGGTMFRWSTDVLTVEINNGEVCKSGINCGKATTESWWPRQEVYLEPNTEYELSYWTKMGYNPENYYTRLNLAQAEQNYLLDCMHQTQTPDWEQKKCTFTTLNSNDPVIIHTILQGSGLPAGRYNYVDDIFLIKIPTCSNGPTTGSCIGIDGLLREPFCSGSNMRTWSCSVLGVCETTTTACVNGCRDGSCRFDAPPTGPQEPDCTYDKRTGSWICH
ncbi:MAG: hypothetical protein ABIJ92_00415 [Candidatus Aenigmatarchaeota archaeon]